MNNMVKWLILKKEPIESTKRLSGKWLAGPRYLQQHSISRVHYQLIKRYNKNFYKISYRSYVFTDMNFSFDLYQGLPMQRRGQGVLHGRDQQVQTRDRKGKELGQVRKKFNCLYFLWKTLRNDMSISTIGLQSRNEENFTAAFIQKWNIQAHSACVFF